MKHVARSVFTTRIPPHKNNNESHRHRGSIEAVAQGRNFSRSEFLSLRRRSDRLNLTLTLTLEIKVEGEEREANDFKEKTSGDFL